jgi:hypothetical protein
VSLLPDVEKAMKNFEHFFILHGKGGSPEGSSKQIQACLQRLRPDLEGLFERPLLLHSDASVPAEQSLSDLSRKTLPHNSLLIGISLGGLLAAKLQEAERNDLHVISISAPTWADGVRLEHRMPYRVALYSSKDEVIAGRTENWPQLATAYDLPWLTHDTDRHKEELAKLILAYVNGHPT